MQAEHTTDVRNIRIVPNEHHNLRLVDGGIGIPARKRGRHIQQQFAAAPGGNGRRAVHGVEDRAVHREQALQRPLVHGSPSGGMIPLAILQQHDFRRA